MYMHALDRMKKVHIWIGTTLLSEDDYYNYFDHVEIMADKTEKEYKKLILSLDVLPEDILMVDNSLKSDIYPALSVGMHAAYIPYHTTWKHELANENIMNDRFFKVNTFSQLNNLLGVKCDN